jgi:hypothetical protein
MSEPSAVDRVKRLAGQGQRAEAVKAALAANLNPRDVPFIVDYGKEYEAMMFSAPPATKPGRTSK